MFEFNFLVLLGMFLVAPIIPQVYTWVKYIHQRIDNNKNFICLISGATGSGKTWVGLSMGELLDPEFGIDRVIFKGSELMDLINSGELKSGSVILWDEAGIDLSSRSWQSMMNKMLNFLLQTFRHKNLVLIMTAPYGDFIDVASRKLFHAEFETVAINKRKKTCAIKPLLLQYNSSNKKWYRKYLQVIKKGIGQIKIKRWNVPKPSDELIEVYEKKKNEFTDSLNKEIGRSLVKIEKDEDTLTDKQRDIVEYWKQGIYNQTFIGSEIGMEGSQLSNNIKWMKKKGYNRDEYKKEYPPREIDSFGRKKVANNLNSRSTIIQDEKGGKKQ